MTTEVDWASLRSAAAGATANSYSPYSNFPVGAAAQTSDGRQFTATNVENASYVAGICAETALVGVLVANGVGRGDIVAVAVTDPAGAPLSPCGRCRQLLHEIGGGDLPVNEQTMRALLPDAFEPEDLA
ncbi:cytidine deaminase [Actinospongicola halichondriae]|uniref:cytidine deaminase n=1 Tax=Actinospongicola halichondriae TaxID=3236844 RepID=UPI003D4A6451